MKGRGEGRGEERIKRGGPQCLTCIGAHDCTGGNTAPNVWNSLYADDDERIKNVRGTNGSLWYPCD